MRILLVSPYFPPQPAIASLRVHAFAKWWARAGADVTVLTTAKQPDQRGLDLECRGFEVIEVPYAIPRILQRARRESSGGGADGSGRGLARRLRGACERRGIFSAVRMPDVTGYWVRPAVEWCAAGGGWDVVVSSSGPYTAHLVAREVRRGGRAGAWVADFRDLWVDNPAHRGVFPFTVRERALERACLDEADRVVTVSDGLARRLTHKTSAPVDVIYNGFDPADAAALSAERAFPSDGRTRLVYTGALYPRGQDPAPLLEALPRNATLVAAGRGCHEWKRRAGHVAPDAHLELRGEVPRTEALRMQRDADALVLVDWNRPEDGVLTGKLFEYMHATAPILAVGPTAATPVGEMIERSGRGDHLGDDVDRIATWIETLGTRALTPDREFIDRFTREAQSMRLLDLLEAATARV